MRPLSDLYPRWGDGGFHAALEAILLERARRLLAGGDAPVAEVMRHCGHADPGTGIHAFRRVTKATPGNVPQAARATPRVASRRISRR